MPLQTKFQEKLAFCLTFFSIHAILAFVAIGMLVLSAVAFGPPDGWYFVTIATNPLTKRKFLVA